MNYASLVDQIKNYANRTDDFFVNSIPDFINQGINRIYYEAKDIGFEKVTQANLTFIVANNEVPKPLDWRETISFGWFDNNLGNVTYLLPRSYEFCLLYDNDLEVTGPLFYADIDYDKFVISPSPDAAYEYILRYLAVPLFNAQNPTNFLTERYPNLLLYSCLMEIIPYLKDDARAQMIEKYYREILEDVKRTAKERQTDRLSTRELV